MACSHPIFAWPNLQSDGTYQFRMLKSVDYDVNDYWLDIKSGRTPAVKFPCRKCLGCRLQKSEDWAVRCLMEQCYHEHSWFLTLTYADEFVPKTFSVDSLTGEALHPHMTLQKSDLQKFIKRLRKTQAVRYFAAGEYGSVTFRPHYHLILFGPDFKDRVRIQDGSAGGTYYTSETISALWPFGMHVLGDCSFQSVAYVARYTMKKAKADVRSVWESFNIQPEFQVMSLKPAIGYQYYLDHPDMFKFDRNYISTFDGSRSYIPPEYFRKLEREKYPIEMTRRFEQKLVNSRLRDQIKFSLTSNHYRAILDIEEEALDNRLKSLTRNQV